MICYPYLPAAVTPVLTGQPVEYEKLRKFIVLLDSQFLCVLADNLHNLKDRAQGIEISFPMLTDFRLHGHAALQHGILRSNSISERAIFIMDRKGIIRYIDIHGIEEESGMRAIIRDLEGIDGKESRRVRE